MKQAKRILSLLLSLCLVLGLVPSTAFAASGNLPFTDVKTTDWFYEAVQYAYENGIMNGTSTTTFSPNYTTERGMIVTVLHRMEGTPSVSGTLFSDVATGKYYADAVAWASANDIVNGYGNGNFGPEDPITREQMATILYRYVEHKGYDTAIAGSLSIFSDASKVSSFAVEGMTWAVGSGLINGIGNNLLDPQGSATRAQMATILMRFCNEVVPSDEPENNEPGTDSPGVNEPKDETYTVTFNLNYGNNGEYSSQVVKAGETVSEPSAPSRSGYSFRGWYTETTGGTKGGTKFDFGTGITSDITLYAHWISNSSSSGGGGYTPSTYTVTFYMNDGTDAVYTTSTAYYGGTISAPTQPTRTGYDFVGWYTDAAGTMAYSFSNPLDGNLALYAKWASNARQLSINKEPFLYDPTADEYYLLDKLDSLSGTLTNANDVNTLSYAVYNEKGRQIESGNIDVSSNWVLGQIGLVPGKNRVVVTAIYSSGQESEEINLYDPLGLNFDTLTDYSKDTDGDGLCDYIEDLLGTDKSNPDTDGDSLTDYQEAIVLGYDPLNPDTDGNGISDAGEDLDEDGLTNAEEYRIGTNPIGMDTDLDGLIDGDEVNLYHTDPLKADTDGDGADDLWEITYGTPGSASRFNTEFLVTESSQTGDLEVMVEVSLPGSQVASLTVEPDLGNAYLDSSLPGYLGAPFSFSLEGGLPSTAEITFVFDPSLLSDPSFNPTIYYFNEETQLLEEQPTMVDVATGTATAIVSHFSSYILLNKTDFDTVWTDEIKPPLFDDDTDAVLDIMFVVDYSASMTNNDPRQIFKPLTKAFIAKMRDGKDRAGIVKFIANATLVSGLTTDKDTLNHAIDSISYDDGYGSNSGTNGSAGIHMALDQLVASESQYKYIIFMTDGEDNRQSYSYDALISTANGASVTMYTVGMGSANEEILRKLADRTGGKYYHATTDQSMENMIILDDVFKDIESETVDLTTDDNKDGVPNYYTKILCEGGEYINGAKNPFYGIPYESVQANDDYDQDGLKNGEEITVTTSKENRVYVKIMSDPTLVNSDNDIYSDYDEVRTYHSDPMRDNIAFEQVDLDYLTGNSNFVANKYVDFYENDWYGWTERVSLWIGNNVFGSNYDTTYLYKCILMEYLQQVVQESEESNQIRELYDLTRESLSVMKDLTDAALKSATADKLDMIENLRQQINTSMRNMDDLANIKVGAGGLTKEQIYRLWDDSYQQYRNATDQISTLNHEIKIDKKVGKGANAVGIVLDVIDVGTTIVDFFNTYSNFSASLSSMDDCISVLKRIQMSSDAPDELKQACSELIRAIDAESASNMDMFWDGMGSIGGKVLRVGASHAVTFIPVVGPYLEAVNMALGLGDFIFNVSDVSQQCTCLYAITKASNIISDSFHSDVSSGELRSPWRNVYQNRTGNADMFFNLAMLRKVSENQMKKADLANSFLIEWLFTKIMYKVDEIDSNVRRIDSIKGKYILAGA